MWYETYINQKTGEVKRVSTPQQAQELGIEWRKLTERETDLIYLAIKPFRKDLLAKEIK